MAEEKKKLQVVEQKEVAFYGDELTAIRANDGQVYVSIRHMCRALGLNTQAQTRRIRRQTILADGYEGGAMMATPGGLQRASVLRVDLVPLWLSGIETSRVKEEIRPKLERFQREASKVLWEAFQEGRLTTDTTLEELLTSDSPTAQAYRMAQAIMQIARQQLLLENRVTTVETRLEAVEAQLGDPGRHITQEQTHNISQSVRAVAMALSKKSKQNEYGRTYGEFYRKFGISAYRELPATKYDEAITWLNEWLQTINNKEVPF